MRLTFVERTRKGSLQATPSSVPRNHRLEAFALEVEMTDDEMNQLVGAGIGVIVGCLAGWQIASTVAPVFVRLLEALSRVVLG